MKWDFEQSDFGGGEISPRLSGQTLSDLYKRALKYASNVVLSPQGDIMSRSGAEFIAQQIAPNNLPVVHLPVMDGPWGSFQLEVGAGPLRMWDRYGRQVPWGMRVYKFETRPAYWPALDGNSEGFSSPAGVSGNVQVDFSEQRFFLQSDGVNPGRIISGFVNHNKALPAGTTEEFTLGFKNAGHDIVLTVTRRDGTVASGPTAYAAGEHSVNFTPEHGGAANAGDFTVQFANQGGAAGYTSSVWAVTLTKNAVAMDDGGTFLPTKNLLGIRHCMFWTAGTFATDIFSMSVNLIAGDTITVGGTVYTAGTQFAVGATIADTVKNFIDSINGSNTGFTAALTFASVPGQVTLTYNVYGSAGNTKTLATSVPGKVAVLSPTFQYGRDPEFYVVIIGGSKVQCLVWTGTSRSDVNGTFVMKALPFQLTSIGGSYGDTTAGQAAIIACAAYQSRLWLTDENGGVYASVVGYGDAVQAFGGSSLFNFSLIRPPKASDALILSLPSAYGAVRWLNVLRGLILGTSRKEAVFSMDAALALDPATGMMFDLVEHSNYGSAENVPAIDVEDKIAFAPPGRQMLRMASIRFEQYGGFKARDVGFIAEHLLRKRISSLCHLRSPASRVVLGFDDGTAAVGLLDEKENCTWTRLTVPAALGNIYSVSSFDTDNGTELWVGTTLGVTLRFRALESTVLSKTFNGAALDRDVMNPPCMDGWVRAPVHGVDATVAYATGLPKVFVGGQAYVILNGRLLGPYAVVADGNLGKVVIPAAEGFYALFVDRTGTIRPAEAYVGVLFPEHKFTTLPLEGGNPAGTSQGLKSRKPQLYARFVDSYLPLINGRRAAERGGADPTDLFAARVDGDVRYTELGFARGDVIDVVQDLPLRFEISILYGGTQMNAI